ncbi:hypothetical protein EB118_22460 [bacterium]|nr:hypothetical protein [bacterium]NDG32819.1 hypothetical protein [bacterium]
MFEAYRAKHQKPKQIVTESLDPVGQEDDDINNDGKVDATDAYLKKKREAIAKSIEDTKKKQSEDAESQAKGKHSDALYIWDYLLHKKNYSPQDAMEIVNMAKAAFEHML